MKAFIVVGTRPQIIKVAPLVKVAQKFSSLSINVFDTGQHYDVEMSELLEIELGIDPLINRPKKGTEMSGLSPAFRLAVMIESISREILNVKPDCLICIGDTDSTLASGLAGIRSSISVVHVEAGLRSYNRNMPEEQNRIAVDHFSDLLFCTSQLAADNLLNEGVCSSRIKVVGDIARDAFDLHFQQLNSQRITNSEVQRALVTLHRKENINSKNRMINFVRFLDQLSEIYEVDFPVHPATQASLSNFDLTISSRVQISQPKGYRALLQSLVDSDVVVTDSGGIQREANWAKKPTLVLRTETEWAELNQQYYRLVDLDKPIDTEELLLELFEQSGPCFKYESVNEFCGTTHQIWSEILNRYG